MINEIFIDPKVISYTSETKDSSDDIKKFLIDLFKTLKIINNHNIKLILDDNTMNEVVTKNPSIPFEKNKISDPRINSFYNDAVKRLKMTLENARIVKFKESCSIRKDIENAIYESDIEYLRLYELLLTGCSLNEKIETDIILKSDNFPSEDLKITVECNSNCSKNFKKIFNCYELKLFEKKILESKVNDFLETGNIIKIQELLESNYKLNGSFSSFDGERKEPYKIECEKSFLKQVMNDCPKSERRKVLDAITKKAYGIYDKGLNDEVFKDCRRFRVSDYWRIHYTEESDEIDLIEFGVHDIGIKH